MGFLGSGFFSDQPRRRGWVFGGAFGNDTDNEPERNKSMQQTVMKRCLIGAYAGEIREYPALVAQQLEADGRVQDPELPYEPNTAQAPEVDFEAYNRGVRARKREEILAELDALEQRTSKGKPAATTKGGKS